MGIFWVYCPPRNHTEIIVTGKIRPNIKFGSFWYVFLSEIKVDPESWWKNSTPNFINSLKDNKRPLQDKLFIEPFVCIFIVDRDLKKPGSSAHFPKSAGCTSWFFRTLALIIEAPIVKKINKNFVFLRVSHWLKPMLLQRSAAIGFYTNRLLQTRRELCQDVRRRD